MCRRLKAQDASSARDGSGCGTGKFPGSAGQHQVRRVPHLPVMYLLLAGTKTTRRKCRACALSCKHSSTSRYLSLCPSLIDCTVSPTLIPLLRRLPSYASTGRCGRRSTRSAGRRRPSGRRSSSSPVAGARRSSLLCPVVCGCRYAATEAAQGRRGGKGA